MYRDTGIQVVRENFDAEKNISSTLERIFSLGRDTNKFKNDSEMYNQIAGSDFAKGVAAMESEGKLPVLGIKEVQDKTLYFLEGWKQVLYNTNKSFALF